MQVELPKVKEDFASIVASITLQPWTMLQFIIWLDLKLSEFKVNGSMNLDKSVGAIPDWLAAISVDEPDESIEDRDELPETRNQQILPPASREDENSSDTIVTGQEDEDIPEEDMPEEGEEEDGISDDEIVPNAGDNQNQLRPPSVSSQEHSEQGDDNSSMNADEHESVNNDSWGPNIAPKRSADAHESFRPEMNPDIKRPKVLQAAPRPVIPKAGAWGTRPNVQHTGHVTIVRDPNRTTIVRDPNRSTIIRDPNRRGRGSIVYRNPVRGAHNHSIITNKVERTRSEQNINQSRHDYSADDPTFDYGSKPDILSMGNTGTYSGAHRSFVNRNRTPNVNRGNRVSSTVTSHAVSAASSFMEMNPMDEEMSPEEEELDESPTHVPQILHRGVARTAVPLSIESKEPIPTHMFVNSQKLVKRGLPQHQADSEAQSSPYEARTSSYEAGADMAEPGGNTSQSDNSGHFAESLNFSSEFQIKTEPEDQEPYGLNIVDPMASAFYADEQDSMERHFKQSGEHFVKAKKKRYYNKRMREEIARYAIETSDVMAAKRFSAEFGFPVRNSTVTRMKDSYIKGMALQFEYRGFYVIHVLFK